MLEYLSNTLNSIAPYIKLLTTMVCLWAVISNSLELSIKLKYSNKVESVDIERIATSVVLFVFAVVTLYIM